MGRYFEPAIPLLGIYFIAILAHVHKGLYYKDVYWNIVCMYEKWKHSVNTKMFKQMMHTHILEKFAADKLNETDL